ncbi:MAG: ABC transporter ATP-binding protein [Bdellovibrionales bacterium]|nr:ABC transporter ATP-binding protein [Bdellovibrionales bacterium]
MVLEVNNLNKNFRHPWNLQKIPVLKDVSFSVPEKSVVGFLGSNGAGKTTTIKCILGILHKTSGDIKILGKDHADISVRKHIGYLPERPYFYNYLTAHEFLKFYGQLSLGIDSKNLENKIDELLGLVGLTHAKNSMLKSFSKGMLQRIGIAQALIHNPKLLILDEPLSGLDPDGRSQMAAVINNARDQGATIFFSSHLLDDVDRLCKDLVVIKDGQVRFCGPKEKFVSRQGRTYQLFYSDQGKEIIESVESLELLQSKIDSLRKQNKLISRVETERISLEEAFRELNREVSL